MYRERYVLLANNAASIDHRHEMTWAQAARLPLCLLTPNMQNRRIITAAFRRAKVHPQVVMETNSMFALYSHVRSGGVVTIVPHSMLPLLDMRRELIAVPLLPELNRAIGLIALEQDPLPPIVAAAWEIAQTLDLTALFEPPIDPGYPPIQGNT